MPLLNPGVTRRWAARHPQATNPRDVIIRFQAVPPNLVKVSETAAGQSIQAQTLPRDLDVVSEMEKKYIFFADEAETARKLIRRGRSCVLSVYFREP